MSITLNGIIRRGSVRAASIQTEKTVSQAGLQTDSGLVRLFFGVGGPHINAQAEGGRVVVSGLTPPDDDSAMYVESFQIED